ncbi:MAG: hypothetical protein K6C40_01095, partial [Thermoguttaceae bacterium]|nr:hypothetical protein [Thermoguttaceae bacterium]
MKNLTFLFTLLFLSFLTICKAEEKAVLDPDAFWHYVEQFNADDEETVRQAFPNEKAWEFMRENIPLLDYPDEKIQRTWYFRWWT